MLPILLLRAYSCFLPPLISTAQELSRDEAEELYNLGRRSGKIRVPPNKFHEFIRKVLEIKPLELSPPDVELYLDSVGIDDDGVDIEDFLLDIFDKPKKNDALPVARTKIILRTYKQDLLKSCADMLHKKPDELQRVLRTTTSSVLFI